MFIRINVAVLTVLEEQQIDVPHSKREREGGEGKGEAMN